MSYKTVQNYQLSEQNSYIQDGIQVYIAQHNTTKLPYLLKKVHTKDSSDKSKYESLINQIGILKKLSSPMVVQCHKMLKTSNNIYLVYDYCDGLPLSELMNTAARQLKISVIKQLVEVLQLMHSAAIVHANLKPSYIIVSNDKKIKLMNFTNGHFLQNKKKVPIKIKPAPSDYVAPEVLKQGFVHQKSDIYSLGVIINEMNIAGQGYLSVESGLNAGKLGKLVGFMLAQNPEERPELEEILSVFRTNQQITPRKKSADFAQKKTNISPSFSLRRGNSQNSDAQKDKKTLSPHSSNQQIKINQKKFVEQILKRRNLAIFLLQMSQTCLKIEQDEKKLGLFLSYMLMKKSCNIICGLLGFIKGQAGYENQIQKPVLDKTERANFQKKSDYLKIYSIIQKQSNNQKRWLQQIHKTITPELPQPLKQLTNPEPPQSAQSALQSAPQSQSTLLHYITQYLQSLYLEQFNHSQLTNKQTENLCLMSEIIPHGSYERMFEELIIDDKIALDQQYLYIHVRKMDRRELVDEIMGRLGRK